MIICLQARRSATSSGRSRGDVAREEDAGLLGLELHEVAAAMHEAPRSRTAPATTSKLPGLDLRHVEQRVDHGEQMLAGIVDDLGVFASPLGLERSSAPVAGKHLGEADDGVERRAQLVADGREETRLRLVGLFGVAAGALELLRSALWSVTSRVTATTVYARCAGLGVDAVGAHLDPDHPGRVPVLAAPRTLRDGAGTRAATGWSRGRVADRLEESRAVGDVHAVEKPAPDEAGGRTPRSFVAAALALTTWPLRSCQVTRSSIACRSERVAGIAQARGRPPVHLDPAMLDRERRGVRDRRDGEDRHRDRRRPRLDRGPDAGGFESREKERRKPAMALAASAARRDPESSASSGTATSHTAAPAETPPEVAAMQTTRPASDAEEIACASARRPLRDSTIAAATGATRQIIATYSGPDGTPRMRR